MTVQLFLLDKLAIGGILKMSFLWYENRPEATFQGARKCHEPNK